MNNRYTFRGKNRPTTSLPEVSISYSSLHSSTPSSDSEMASDAERPPPPMDAAMAATPRPPVIVPEGGAEQAEPDLAPGRDGHPESRRDLFPDQGSVAGAEGADWDDNLDDSPPPAADPPPRATIPRRKSMRATPHIEESPQIHGYRSESGIAHRASPDSRSRRGNRRESYRSSQDRDDADAFNPRQKAPPKQVDPTGRRSMGEGE
jgi:hypothetical protein